MIAMEADTVPEVSNSATEASASEMSTAVKSAAASEMSATASMPAAACRRSRSRRQDCAKGDHAKQFQSLHHFSPAT
ncbi:hypothetical protein [Bradyrhizobium sp. USDA 377]